MEAGPFRSPREPVAEELPVIGSAPAGTPVTSMRARELDVDGLLAGQLAAGQRLLAPERPVGQVVERVVHG